MVEGEGVGVDSHIPVASQSFPVAIIYKITYDCGGRLVRGNATSNREYFMPCCGKKAGAKTTKTVKKAKPAKKK